MNTNVILLFFTKPINTKYKIWLQKKSIFKKNSKNCSVVRNYIIDRLFIIELKITGKMC